ncbi:MAG: hypothetical protein WBG73_21970 [Coleofasciculaceae cyanobacterium]
MFKGWIGSSLVLLVSVLVIGESGQAYTRRLDSSQSNLETKVAVKQNFSSYIRRQISRQINRLRVLRKPNNVTNSQLRGAVNNLFRSGDRTVPGGTAGAIIYEKITGRAVGGRSHIEKGQGRARQLERILQQEILSPQDQTTARNMLNDLLEALNFTP